ncbi:ribonuclease H family protein [Neobacillus mesonae]|nr:ribonuclease H family protein [Neobacillus mesonae]
MAKQKYYVVWEGKTPGIYTSWPACQQQVNGVNGAKYKAFESKAEAEKAYANGWKGIWGSTAGKPQGASVRKTQDSLSAPSEEVDYNSISVDVGTRGNPGPMEYKGVDTQTGDMLFSVGPIPNGTNNIGEFLAIVHALAYLKQQGSSKTVYSDSVNAMKWVKQKKAATTLKRDASTQQVWELIDRAESWLKSNTYSNKILKWQTKAWGEIKADYGRK